MTRVFVAALVAALCVPLAACNSPGDDPGTPIPVDPAALYERNCARCHGAEGRGDPQIRLQMPVRDFTDPAFRVRQTPDLEQVIMAGKGQMPAFGGLLSPPKIQSLVGYVRRLGAGR